MPLGGSITCRLRCWEWGRTFIHILLSNTEQIGIFISLYILLYQNQMSDRAVCSAFYPAQPTLLTTHQSYWLAVVIYCLRWLITEWKCCLITFSHKCSTGLQVTANVCIVMQALSFFPLAFLGIQCLTSPEGCVFLMCFLTHFGGYLQKAVALELCFVFFFNLFCFSLPWNVAMKSTFSDHKEQCVNANTNTSVSIGHSMAFKRLQECTWA